MPAAAYASNFAARKQKPVIKFLLSLKTVLWKQKHILLK